MSKEEIFNYFYTNSANLGIKSILIIMIAAFLIGAVIFCTYYFTYKGVAYNNSFNISLIILLLISVVIMLMISSNIVISLGMVGALSIIRFRTAIKDSKDTVFIFWAITEGLCVGSQNFKLAIVTTMFISMVMLAGHLIPNFCNKYIIVVRGGKEIIDTAKLIEKMKPFVLNSKLKSANRDDNNQEMIFEVKTKGEINLNIISELSNIEGVKQVNWVSQSNDILG